jgi:hypothetical protein
MELLERYLQAVRTYLPMSQQEDILQELRENLRGQIEDRESALGRPLNEDELAEILKKHGHPLLVATRYRQSRHLIGSTLFPFYWLVMKIILAIVGFGYAVSVLVMIAQGKLFFEVLGALLNYVGAVLPTFAIVTIVFAVLDIGNSKFRLLERATKATNENFNPRMLPMLRSASDLPDAKPISRFKTAFELFFSAAFLLWWVRVNPIRKLALFVALGPVGLADKIPFQLGPVWNIIYWPVISLSLVAIVQQIVTLIYPDRIKVYSVMKLITNGGSALILYLVTRVNDILVIAPGVSDPWKFAETVRIINMTLHYTLLFSALMALLECFKQMRRLVRVRSGTATAGSTMI